MRITQLIESILVDMNCYLHYNSELDENKIEILLFEIRKALQQVSDSTKKKLALYLVFEIDKCLNSSSITFQKLDDLKDASSSLILLLQNEIIDNKIDEEDYTKQHLLQDIDYTKKNLENLHATVIKICEELKRYKTESKTANSMYDKIEFYTHHYFTIKDYYQRIISKQNLSVSNAEASYINRLLNQIEILFKTIDELNIEIYNEGNRIEEDVFRIANPSKKNHYEDYDDFDPEQSFFWEYKHGDPEKYGY
jgi:hypothetical protein